MIDLSSSDVFHHHGDRLCCTSRRPVGHLHGVDVVHDIPQEKDRVLPLAVLHHHPRSAPPADLRLGSRAPSIVLHW